MRLVKIQSRRRRRKRKENIIKVDIKREIEAETDIEIGVGIEGDIEAEVEVEIGEEKGNQYLWLMNFFLLNYNLWEDLNDKIQKRKNVIHFDGLESNNFEILSKCSSAPVTNNILIASSCIID